MKKENNKLVIVLIVAVVIFGGIIVKQVIDFNSNDNSNTNTPSQEKQPDINNSNVGQASGKKYDVSDYISVTDYEILKNCSNCKTHGIVKKVEFKNLPLRTTTEFISKHEEILFPEVDLTEETKISNEIVYGTYNNILSIFEKDIIAREELGIGSGKIYNYYSLNINLDNQKIVTNQELLEIYNIKPADMYNKILNNIANTVSVDSFLLSTIGDVTAETIKVDDFKKNINTYASYIDNRFDVVNLYLKENKVYAVYKQNKILEILGMGQHMNIGLVEEPQIIEIN